MASAITSGVGGAPLPGSLGPSQLPRGGIPALVIVFFAVAPLVVGANVVGAALDRHYPRGRLFTAREYRPKMSNQVYASPQHKYFAQPGLTIWDMPSDLVVPGTGATSVIPFNAVPTVNQGSADFLTKNVDNSFTVNQEGVYSIKYIANLEAVTPGILEMQLGVRIVDGAGAADGAILDKVEPIYDTGAAGIDELSPTVSLSAVTFFPQGASFDFYARNDLSNVLRTITVGQADSRLFICKIV